MRILIFGVGGHARVVADIIIQEGWHEIVGLVSHNGRLGALDLGFEVVAGNDDFGDRIVPLNIEGAVIALGDSRARKHLAGLIGDRLSLVTAIHPAAVVAPDVRIGEGTVIMAGAVVNPGTKIGRHCIINTSASVDHDCRVGSFTHIGPGVRVAGHVSIGQECSLGIGSVVIDHITMGDRTKLRAGTVVTRDIPSSAKP